MTPITPPMTEPPAWIGLCPNRVGEAKYVVAGVFLDEIKTGDVPVCEHCGEPLILYERESD